jgi:hypothetical protein
MENNKHVQKKIGLARLFTWMKKQGKYWVQDHKEGGEKLEQKNEPKSKVIEGISPITQDGEGGNNSKSSEIVKNEEADIFRIVTTEDGSFVALGNNRLTEFVSEEDAYRMVIDKDWQLIFNVIATTAKAIINTTNQKE